MIEQEIENNYEDALEQDIWDELQPKNDERWQVWDQWLQRPSSLCLALFKSNYPTVEARKKLFYSISLSTHDRFYRNYSDWNFFLTLLAYLENDQKIEFAEMFIEIFQEINFLVENGALYFLHLPKNYWEKLSTLIPITNTNDLLALQKHLAIYCIEEADITEITQLYIKNHPGLGESTPIIIENLFPYGEWLDTCKQLVAFLGNKKQFIELLYSLDDDLKGAVGYSRPYNNTICSIDEFDLKRYNLLLDQLLLEKERKHGFNLPTIRKDGSTLDVISYFNGIANHESFINFQKKHPGCIPKETIINDLFIAHGGQIHRIFWYAVLIAIEKGIIKLPSQKTPLDFYIKLLENVIIGTESVTLWGKLLDLIIPIPTRLFSSPASIHSLLLYDKEVISNLPNLHRYVKNSLNKKVAKKALEISKNSKTLPPYSFLIKNGFFRTTDSIFYEDYPVSSRRDFLNSDGEKIASVGDGEMYFKAVPLRR